MAEILEKLSSALSARPVLGAAVAAGCAALFTAGLYTLILCLSRALHRRPPKERELRQSAVSLEIGKLHEQGAREYQQDCFSVTPAENLNQRGVLAVVADGMGGLENGDLVSQTAVQVLVNGFLESADSAMEPLLWELLRQCNTTVNDLLGEENLRRSGSTLVAGLIRDGKYLWMSVGDSRLYLYRDGALIQLNREHIFLRELQLRAVNGRGALSEAYQHPKGSGLTSYLGRGELKYVDMPDSPLEVFTGDVLLLMSDGVYNALTDKEIQECLQGSTQEMAQALGQTIAEKALPHQDNYTAVVLKLTSEGQGVDMDADI